jgi:hypothetical protein
MSTVCRYIFLLALGGWLSSQVASCATTTAVVATVKDCGNQVTNTVARGILNDVSTAVVCDGGSVSALPACVLAGLASIAKQAGWAAVDCALAEVQKDAASNVNNLPAASAPDEQELLRWRRASAAIAWRSGPDGGSGTAPPGAP